MSPTPVPKLASSVFFEKLLTTVNMFGLVEFLQQNLATTITLVLKDIKDTNDEYYKRAAAGK